MRKNIPVKNEKSFHIKKDVRKRIDHSKYKDFFSPPLSEEEINELNSTQENLIAWGITKSRNLTKAIKNEHT